MNRVIFLDPPYSLLFNSLAINLRNNHGVECCAYLYNPADVIYCISSKIRCSPRVKSSSVVAINRELEPHIYAPSLFMAFNEGKLSNRQLSCIHSYLQGFIEIYRDGDLVVIYNDMRWNHAPVISWLKSFGGRYLVIERGAIRGAVLSLDKLGVNSRSYFRQNKSRGFAVDSYSLPGVKVDKLYYVPLFFVHFLLTFAFSYFFGRSYFDMRTSKSTSFYLSLFFSRVNSFILKNLRSISAPGIPRHSTPSSQPSYFMFVPLQVSTDSQLLMSDTFSTNNQLIDFVHKMCSDFCIDKKNILFKPHPLCSEKFNLDQFSVMHTISSHSAIAISDRVLVINSTVGFEALTLGKPVLALSQSFYTFDDWVFGEAELPEFVSKDVESKVAPEIALSEVVSNYSVPGDVFSFTGENSVFLAESVVSYMHEDER